MAAEPTERERSLALWFFGDDEPKRARFALVLAYYREELLAPFVAMHEDYCTLGDTRVATDLERLIRTIKGVP